MRSDRSPLSCLTHACCGLLLLATMSGGCARMRRLRTENARLEAMAKVEGKINVEHWSGDPLLVMVMEKPKQLGAPVVVKRNIPLNRPGPYTTILEPGFYLLGVLEDKNRNQRYDVGERAAAYRNLEAFDLSAAGARKQIDLTITDEVPAILREPSDIKVLRPTEIGEGSVVPLTDPRFALENATLGVWQPATFQEKVGMGVFMLEAYDPARIPVVFVHGMGGHPREFETLIHCLDKQRFQAWVVQYASGWALEPIARGLNYVLTRLQRKHEFARAYVVAHSMGGLVSRRMLREHVESNPTPFITKLVTLCSPLGGMPSADMGVEMAPAVVPSWRDIGPKSQFVKHLYEKPLPPAIEYSLFFAFADGEASDGVVALSSQLRHEARREAAHLAAFENTHTGVLKDPEVCTALMKELSR